jgi:hypothetical protein
MEKTSIRCVHFFEFGHCDDSRACDDTRGLVLFLQYYTYLSKVPARALLLQNME